MEFKGILNKINYNKLKMAYIFIFIIAVFSRVFLPIALLETSFINSLVFGTVALFGLFVFMMDCLTKRIFLQNRNKIWLILFLLSTAISCLLNLKYGFVGNLRNLVWLIISFFVVFPIDSFKNKEEILKEMDAVGVFLTITWFFGIVISLFMFLFQIGYYVHIPPNSYARQGFVEGRLFGIFEDPNFAALISVFTILFSLRFFKKSCKLSLKIFWVSNIILQFFYVVLSGSRTVQLAFILMIFICTYLVLKIKKIEFINKNFLKQFFCLIISLGCCFFVIFSFRVIEIGLSYLPSVLKHNIFNKGHSSSLVKPIDTTREDLNQSSDVSNCRFKIWIAALEIFKHKPVFGTSPRNMRQFAKEELPNNYIGLRNYAVHNFYIDVLISTGIIGALFLLVFLIKYLIKLINFLFFNCNFKNYNLILFLN